jgi:hypothetical protein
LWPRGCRTGPLLGIDPISPPPLSSRSPARQPRVAPHWPGWPGRRAGREPRQYRCGWGGGWGRGGPPRGKRRGTWPGRYRWGFRPARPPLLPAMPTSASDPPLAPEPLCPILPDLATQAPPRPRPLTPRQWPRACWSALLPLAPQQGPGLVLRRPGRPARGASEVSRSGRCETGWLSGWVAPPQGSGGLLLRGGPGGRRRPPFPSVPTAWVPCPPPFWPFILSIPSVPMGRGGGGRGEWAVVGEDSVLGGEGGGAQPPSPSPPGMPSASPPAPSPTLSAPSFLTSPCRPRRRPRGVPRPFPAVAFTVLINSPSLPATSSAARS